MFLNYTNHPIESWSDKQLKEAKKYGEIKEIVFPTVSPEMNTEQIHTMAKNCAREIESIDPNAVLIQGEMCLTYAIIEELKKTNIKLLCACSCRNTKEFVENGKNIKKVVFEFVKFREYY